MKFKEGIIIAENGDEHIIVAAGKAGKNFSGMIKMNKSATFIAGLLQKDTTVAEMTEALLDNYDITRDKAEQSVISVLNQFKSVGLIEE